MGFLKKKKAPGLTPEAQRDVDLLVRLRKDTEVQEAEKERAYTARGEAVAAGMPADGPTADYDAAVKRIADLNAAIAAVERRMGAALERLKAEEHKYKRQELLAALTDLQTKARAIEANLETLRRDTKALETSFSAARAAAAAIADEALVHRLNDGMLKFKFYLLHACQIMPGCQTPYVEHLKPYAENFPAGLTGKDA